MQLGRWDAATSPVDRLRVVIAGMVLMIIGITYQAGWRQGRDSTVPPTPVTTHTCDGKGLDSWCVVDGINPDGSEWLFNEAPDGTIVGIYQTPPKD